LKLTCGACEKEPPGTVESFLQHFKDKAQKAREELGKNHLDYPGSSCDELYQMWILEAQVALSRAYLMEDNINLVSSTYWFGLGCQHGSFYSGWLSNQIRNGYREKWPINDRPDNVTIEWQRAVSQWLQQFMPTMHQNWGIWRKETESIKIGSSWKPSYDANDSRHKFYVHVQELQKKWAWFNDEERRREEALIDKILDEISEEEKALLT